MWDHLDNSGASSMWRVWKEMLKFRLLKPSRFSATCGIISTIQVPVPCDVCGKRCWSFDYLSLHVSLRHVGSSRQFRCCDGIWTIQDFLTWPRWSRPPRSSLWTRPPSPRSFPPPQSLHHRSPRKRSPSLSHLDLWGHQYVHHSFESTRRVSLPVVQCLLRTPRKRRGQWRSKPERRTLLFRTSSCRLFVWS